LRLGHGQSVAQTRRRPVAEVSAALM
jgi:hypothetical protein